MENQNYTEQELARILKDMAECPIRGKVVSIHLFGIIYGEYIKENKYNIDYILNLSGLNHSYKTELRKGINLSHFVKLK